jgi:hypothetical protein
MKKFRSSFNPILEDQNYFIYQKLVEACFGFVEDIEHNLNYPEQTLSIMAYLAKQVYDMGFSDGLVVDNVCDEDIKETIFN